MRITSSTLIYNMVVSEWCMNHIFEPFVEGLSEEENE